MNSSFLYFFTSTILFYGTFVPSFGKQSDSTSHLGSEIEMKEKKSLNGNFDRDRGGRLSDDKRAKIRKKLASKIRRFPPHLLQRFDTNEDGELNDEERSAARQAWEDRKQEMLKKFDADGDGKLNVEERREAIKQAKVNPGKEAKKTNLEEGNKQDSKGKKKSGNKKPKGKKKDS